MQAEKLHFLLQSGAILLLAGMSYRLIPWERIAQWNNERLRQRRIRKRDRKD